MHEKIRVLINPTYQTRARTSSRFLNIDINVYLPQALTTFVPPLVSYLSPFSCYFPALFSTLSRT